MFLKTTTIVSPTSAKELRQYLIRDEEAYRYGGYPPNSRISTYALSSEGKYLAAASNYGNNSYGASSYGASPTNPLPPTMLTWGR